RSRKITNVLSPCSRNATCPMTGVPEISRFLGIVIHIHYNDHAPPHFHARCSGMKATIEIRSHNVLEGNLPNRTLKLAREWAELHETELLEAWQMAVQGLPPKRIEPLK